MSVRPDPTLNARALIAAVLLLAASCRPHASDADRTRLRGLLASVRDSVTSADLQRRQRLAQVASMPSPQIPQQCPAGVARMSSNVVSNFLRSTAVPIPDTRTPQVASAEGLYLSVFAHEARTFEYVLGTRDLEPTRVPQLERDIRQQGEPARWHPYEIDFVITGFDVPEIHDFARFSGGTISGRALVWGYQQRDVVCWTPVVAGLRDTERVQQAGRESQNRDLLSLLLIEADSSAVAALGLTGVPRAPDDTVE